MKLKSFILLLACIYSCGSNANKSNPEIKLETVVQSNGAILVDVSKSQDFSGGKNGLQFRHTIKENQVELIPVFGFGQNGDPLTGISAETTISENKVLKLSGSYGQVLSELSNSDTSLMIQWCVEAMDSKSRTSTLCKDIELQSSTGSGGETPSFSIGGTVSGLSGALVLANHGGDLLHVSQDGAFSFETKLVSGAPYLVTISSKPIQQNCVLSQGEGMVSDSNIQSISVSCTSKAWTHPTSLSDNISLDDYAANFPKVAMDLSGNALIVWRQSDGISNQIFKSEYRDDEWVHPMDLNDNISPDGAAANVPRVSMAGNGDASIVWVQSDGVANQSFASRYHNGAWIHPSSLSDNLSPDGQSVVSCQLAMDSQGNELVAWSQFNGSNTQVYKSEYSSSLWQNPSGLLDHVSQSSQNASSTSVAMDDLGNKIITWIQSDGSFSQVFKSEYRSGAWVHPTSLVDNFSPDGSAASSSQVAMDSNGNAIVVWVQSDGSFDQVFKSEYRSGAWTHPSTLSDNISPDASSASVPQVAMDENGNAIIVWQQTDEGFTQIYKSEYRAGVWSHPTSLSDNISIGSSHAVSPVVAMDRHGNAVIVWLQSDGSFTQTFKSEYRLGAWVHPSSLSDNISPDLQSSSQASVAMDGLGNTIIVWQQSDGSRNQIFKSEFR